MQFKRPAKLTLDEAAYIATMQPEAAKQYLVPIIKQHLIGLPSEVAWGTSELNSLVFADFNKLETKTRTYLVNRLMELSKDELSDWVHLGPVRTMYGGKKTVRPRLWHEPSRAIRRDAMRAWMQSHIAIVGLDEALAMLRELADELEAEDLVS